jgi:hypothetical protein
MADTSTDAVAPASVWVQLYWDNNEKSGEPFEIEPIPKNVNDLKKAVKDGFTTELQHCGYARLKVYPEPPFAGQEYIPANTLISSLIAKPSYYTPLIVIAPKPREQQNGELRFCFRIHCCIQTRSNLVFNLLFE